MHASFASVPCSSKFKGQRDKGKQVKESENGQQARGKKTTGE